MYGGSLSLNLPEQILNYVIPYDNFKFVQQLTDDDNQTWIVYEKSNGRTCIAKKYLISRPTNVELHKYYQEVVILSQIDNFFVSSLIGFTNKSPYCIFMQYRKNSTLYQALHIDKTSYPFTGAHLTNIAMGIAYGMIKIQEMKMTEPYLSSSNIFLTSELIPKICHFKTTPDPIKWKAPELYQSLTKAKYDMGLDESDISESQKDIYKADVFAYGLILHELLTRRDYFCSMSPERVKKIVYDDNKRPSIPKNAPQMLQKLIRDCWSQNPSKRPSFTQIFECFESGEVSFPNTNSETVDAMLKRIKRHESNVANTIKMENYKQEVAHTFSHRKSSPKSVSPHSRKSSPFSNKRGHQSITPNKYGHHHHHRRQSVNRQDFNFFNDDNYQMQQNFVLSDAPTRRRSSSASHEKNRFINTSINHNNNTSLTGDNEFYFSTNNSSDSGFVHLNAITTSTTRNKNKRSSTSDNDDQESSKKKSSKRSAASLSVFQDCSNPQFYTSLENLPQKIAPYQYSQFFKIIAKYFSGDWSQKVVLAVCETIQRLLKKSEAMDEFINQDLFKFLPIDDQKLIGSTFEILYLLFDYSPQSFQVNFTQQMSLLIRKNPEKALTLISLFAKSFNKINDPWSFLDLLFQHSEIFLRSNVGSEYVSVLFFLNFSFSTFAEEKKGQSRQILVRFLSSSDKHAVNMTYRAICNLFDDFFKIPLDIMAKDLIDPDMNLLAISVMLRMKDSDLIPNKRTNVNLTEIVCPLLKIAEAHEEATLLLLRYLKHTEAAKIVLRNSLCLTKNLPTFQDTLKIFISLMTHSSLRSSIAEIEVLPEFFTSLIKSDKIQCMVSLQSLITRLNLKKKIFRNLIEHKFFSILLNSFGSYNDDRVTISNLTIMTYFATNVGESTEYLIFSDCLKTLIWSKNQNISLASFKCLYAMSFYPQCASRYKQMKLDEAVLELFTSDDGNTKVQKFLQNLEKAEVSD